MVQLLLGQINEKTRENFDLQCQLDWLKRQLFGRKSETMDPNQRLLFADLFREAPAATGATTRPPNRLAAQSPPGEPPLVP